MKNHTYIKFVISVIALVFLFSTGCQEEEENLTVGIETIDLIIKDVTRTTLIFEGEVITAVPTKIFNKGIVWDFEPEPNTRNGIRSFGRGGVTFGDTLRGLSPFRTYYARGFASNVTGTLYGPEVIFTTAASFSEVPCKPDSNSYTIGSNTTRFTSVRQGSGNGNQYSLEARGKINVVFSAAPQSGTYRIEGGYNTFVSDGECNIWGAFGGTWSNRYNGVKGDSLFVEQLGVNQYNVTFCGINFEGANTTNRFTTDGNITYR